MSKPGIRPKGKVNIKWSSDFAYAIGLLATDGNLSPDGRHISFVSKDIDQVENFLQGLNIQVLVSETFSGYSHKLAWRVQFSDTIFYEFLNSIGLFKNKSKMIGKVLVPDEYFFDFLRGCFDGDGTAYSYFDKRWKSSFMFYISFITASERFVLWLREEINERLGVFGHIKMDGRRITYQLTYAKRDSIVILKKIYEKSGEICLPRKKLKIEAILAIVGKSKGLMDKRAGGEIGRRTTLRW